MGVDKWNRLVYGFPCEHKIYKYHSDGLPIPIEIVDDHWRQLNYIPQVEESLKFVHTVEFAYIKKLFDSSTAEERRVLLLKIREIALPATTSILEPKIEKHKGRPSGSKNKSISKQVKHQKSTKQDPSTFEIAKTANEILSQASVNKKLPSKRKNPVVKFDKCDVKTTNSDFKYLAYLPAFLHQYIDNVEDVMGDDNCGFRCVVEQVDELNFDWREARKSILAELMKNWDLYVRHFDITNCEELKSAIDCDISPCFKANWMIMPETGYLVANAFNRVVVYISNHQSLTFFLHERGSGLGHEHRFIVFANILDYHFIKLTLRKNAHIPPVASFWNRLATKEAKVWSELYVDRQIEFVKLCPPDMATNDDH